MVVFNRPAGVRTPLQRCGIEQREGRENQDEEHWCVHDLDLPQ